MFRRSFWSRVSIFAGATYLICCLGLYLIQDRLLFFRKPSDFTDCPPMIQLGAQPTQNDHLRYYEKKAPRNQMTLIVFHGNASTACTKDWLLQGLIDLPLNFIFVEYPGYADKGNSPSTPSEIQILEEAEQIFEIATQMKTKIVLFGESLGSGVATYLASKYDVAGLILQSPYTSIADIAQSRYKIFPIHFLLKHPFDASKWAPKVHSPALILRAEKDEVIPVEITNSQIGNFSTSAKIVSFPLARHNSMRTVDADLYWKSVRDFILRLSPSKH